jgi:hypothetical protein
LVAELNGVVYIAVYVGNGFGMGFNVYGYCFAYGIVFCCIVWSKLNRKLLVVANV